MKNTLIAIVSAAMLSLTACNFNQAGASATYIAAETATADLISKHPEYVPAVKALVADWTKFENGTITPADEVALLQTIVTATKAKVTPTEAALLDGAIQQILANQNSTAPTPLQGSAAAIITTVINGASRAVTIASPTTTSKEDGPLPYQVYGHA
jgi:hypothetical protein